MATDSLWLKYCGAIEKPDWIDHERFGKAPDRVRNRDELMPLLAEVMKTKTRAEWIKVLGDAGVPCGSISTVAEICESETLKARGMIWEMEHATAGQIRTIANPIEFTGTTLAAPAAPPRLGEHTDDVLTNLAGYSPDQIAALKEQGVI